MFISSELVNIWLNIFSDQMNHATQFAQFFAPTCDRKGAPLTSNSPKPFVEIGARIRSARKALGLKQNEFAIRAGLKNSQVSNWESGLYRPSLDNCIVLRETYGLSIDFIIFGNLDALPHKIAKQLSSQPSDNLSQ